ncbi:CotH kinase family protein [Eupransor demetentiae]|uniref:Spore coat protein CotH (CotH) n=1 Tax=Eupransor demetentiae TaxID=3109584 RepID=A0ABP0EPE3_9LACO|nr:Spore coat protein CotH (CotH) [Lactobacillaceae bacterium LMG 33000]
MPQSVGSYKKLTYLGGNETKQGDSSTVFKFGLLQDEDQITYSGQANVAIKSQSGDVTNVTASVDAGVVSLPMTNDTMSGLATGNYTFEVKLSDGSIWPDRDQGQFYINVAIDASGAKLPSVIDIDDLKSDIKAVNTRVDGLQNRVTTLESKPTGNGKNWQPEIDNLSTANSKAISDLSANATSLNNTTASSASLAGSTASEANSNAVSAQSTANNATSTASEALSTANTDVSGNASTATSVNLVEGRVSVLEARPQGGGGDNGKNYDSEVNSLAANIGVNSTSLSTVSTAGSTAQITAQQANSLAAANSQALNSVSTNASSLTTQVSTNTADIATLKTNGGTGTASTLTTVSDQSMTTDPGDLRIAQWFLYRSYFKTWGWISDDSGTFTKLFYFKNKSILGTKWGDLTNVFARLTQSGDYSRWEIWSKPTDYYSSYDIRVIEGKQSTEMGSVRQFEIEASGSSATNDGIPVLTLTGKAFGINPDSKVIMPYSLTDALGNTISTGYATVKQQGDSSQGWERANYGLSFFSDAAATKSQTVHFNLSMEPVKKASIKSNYIDETTGRNIVAQRNWAEINQSKHNPAPQIQTGLNNGAIDGYPVKLLIVPQGDATSNPVNNYGIYTFQYQDAYATYGLDANKPDTNIGIYGGDGAESSSLTTNDPSFSVPSFNLDGSHQWAYLTKQTANSDAAVQKLAALGYLADTDNYENFKSKADSMLDFESIFDYISHALFWGDGDAWKKNQTWVTYDGVKWGMQRYDNDNILGMDWTGAIDTGSNSVTRDLSNFLGNHMLLAVKKYKPAELKARYFELRNTGVLSAAHGIALYKQYMRDIPIARMQEQESKFTTSPSLGKTGIQQVQQALVIRQKLVDDFMNSLA